MVKTFEELIEEKFKNEQNYSLTSGDLYDIKTFCLELLKLVRSQTLIEASNKADADYIFIKDVDGADDIEVYVLKESILGLDKNSIEI